MIPSTQYSSTLVPALLRTAVSVSTADLLISFLCLEILHFYGIRVIIESTSQTMMRGNSLACVLLPTLIDFTNLELVKIFDKLVKIVGVCAVTSSPLTLVNSHTTPVLVCKKILIANCCFSTLINSRVTLVLV